MPLLRRRRKDGKCPQRSVDKQGNVYCKGVPVKVEMCPGSPVMVFVTKGRVVRCPLYGASKRQLKLAKKYAEKGYEIMKRGDKFVAIKGEEEIAF